MSQSANRLHQHAIERLPYSWAMDGQRALANRRRFGKLGALATAALSQRGYNFASAL
jgi:hypothetical protein